MCGLAGFIDYDQVLIRTEASATVQRMADTLTHRGPDDCGIWHDMDTGVSLAHRRLSILDLSPAGHQPMLSACGRYVIVFNGEIYNHLELRRELEANNTDCLWRGHSDTETLLAAIAHWGLASTLQRMSGMFALALWDRQCRTLSLARDRLGEKPLYYGWIGKTFVFASELKALRAHPHWHGEIDRDALTLLLRYGYIPAPHSIYRGIRKLLPACLLTCPADHTVAPQPIPYWSASEVALSGIHTPFTGGINTAIDELEAILSRAVRRQMLADVPLGAFLSGGIDSSTIVALMQQQSARPIQTFTIGFHETSHNEAEHAKAVAKHLGTEHTELYVSAQQAMDVIPQLAQLYDEPFADCSQIPTFLVSQLARRHVAVSLSGDGGDELFGGYQRYFIGQKLWQKIHYIPSELRRCIAAGIHHVQPETWNHIFSQLHPVLPHGMQFANPGDKLHKLADVLAVHSANDLCRELLSHWKQPETLVLNSQEPITMDCCPAALTNIFERMMFLDLGNYLPDDILVKVDRAAMGVSLETRVPMLDHEVVEFAWKIPLTMKVQDGQGKHLLRQLLYRHVPRALIDRPKMGFGIPIDQWLRGPLRDWAETLLDEKRLRREGYFDPIPVRKKWQEHLSGLRNWQHYLWSILMFQAWLEHEHA